MSTSSVAQIKYTCLHPDVYQPSDDSFALVDALCAAASAWQSVPPRVCAEIGSGSGYVICSVALLLSAAHITAQCFAVDLSEAATLATQQTLAAHSVKCVELVQADLLAPFLPHLQGLVDLLVFNPPYVPTPPEEISKGGLAAAWAGGDHGRAVIDRVLPLLDDLLSSHGHFFMVTVAENGPASILEQLRGWGLQGRIALTRNADEERLSILHCWR